MYGVFFGSILLSVLRNRICWYIIGRREYIWHWKWLKMILKA